jgi:hypothetical protein
MSKRYPVKLWSPYRPQRPAVDPLYQDILEIFNADTRSVWTKANESGLSTTTIYNWRKGKTKHPSSTSLQLAAKMLGYTIKFEKD